MNWIALIVGVALLAGSAAAWQFLWIADLRTSTPERFVLLAFALVTAAVVLVSFGVHFIIRAFHS